jgi:hypothetical protein
MRRLLILIPAFCLTVIAPCLVTGNPVIVPDWPREFLEIYTFEEEPAELPSYLCEHAIVDPGPPPWYENLPFPCYAAKVPWSFAYVPIHVEHLGSGSDPEDGGYLAVRYGIAALGEPVTFVAAEACSGFLMGPSIAGPPAAILFSSTVGCFDWQFHAGYAYWKNNSTLTDATFFNIVPNADDGDYRVLNCDLQWDETTAIGHGAQWGGTKIITAIELTTWGTIKTLYR